MQVRTRHTPAYGVARLLLAPGEAIQADYDALLSASYGVAIDVRPRGGGRSKRVQPTLFTAPPEGGWVDVAPSLPGEVYTLELEGITGWCVTRGSTLAASSTIQFDANWAPFRPMFGAEQGFLDHVSGQGSVVLSSCGALDVVNLEPGAAITVTPACVVAYTEGTQTRLRAISQSLPQSMRTGEGLLLDFAGPGQVLTQTRKPQAMIAALS
ncbi:AIM24 family protein [Kibdelosporangium aridum]|uniref:TIGR00266 family protein n=1 Tax=Kibdelosporangium aridum TaxID=2030 RepID=A0A1W2DUA6_KIBAR|nr:AIM24 family protein [Kibdelosporangium aridum]SMD00977.1 TIGR00266 family protein [Kibdelosporangium aridum]